MEQFRRRLGVPPYCLGDGGSPDEYLADLAPVQFLFGVAGTGCDDPDVDVRSRAADARKGLGSHFRREQHRPGVHYLSPAVNGQHAVADVAAEPPEQLLGDGFAGVSDAVERAGVGVVEAGLQELLPLGRREDDVCNAGVLHEAGYLFGRPLLEEDDGRADTPEGEDVHRPPDERHREGVEVDVVASGHVAVVRQVG